MPRNLITSDLAIRAVKMGDARKRLTDGDGLYLLLFVKGGAHGWRFDYAIDGRRKTLSLGTFPDVGLAAARKEADRLRGQVAAGTDPSDTRKAQRQELERRDVVRKVAAAGGPAHGTFQAIALEWLAHQAGRWTGDTAAKILTSLENDAFKALGARAIGELTAHDVLDVIQAVELRGAGEQASRLLQRVKAVFRYAVVPGKYITHNPTIDLKAAEILRPRQVLHRAALPESELPRFLLELDAYAGDPSTANALRLLLLTVPRPGELRPTPWAELPPGVTSWRIPGPRMKMKDEHIIPLSRQAIAVIDAQRQISAGDPLVFPSPFYPGKPLSENTLNSALARMGYKGIATAHGFRALFSTAANEQGWDGDVIERHLAHAERNQVRAAYHRALYLKERAELMQWWADYLDSKRKPTTPTKG